MVVDAIQQCLDEAERAVRAGRQDEARNHFQAALAIDEAEPTARNWLGADALGRMDAETAAIHFGKACESEPLEPSHWINLATAHRVLDDSESERLALERVLAIDQTNLLALIRMAQLHERAGEEGQAGQRWAAVLMLASGMNDVSPEFAKVLDHAGRYVGQLQRQRADRIEAALAAELAEASERERRRVRAATDAWLGRRQIFANHCEGLHYPFLPADEFFDRDQFPWLSELEAATATITAELEAVLADPGATLAPYISLPPGVPANKWSGLDKSLAWGAFHLWKEGERYDAACERVPSTAALVESLPLCHIEGRAPNVFFSVLKAGSHIPPHTGVTNVRGVVHLPLIVPDGCAFRVGGETRNWAAGEAFAFDDTIEHEAWNRSQRDRAVLIIDVWNPHLSEHERMMVRTLYQAGEVAPG